MEFHAHVRFASHSVYIETDGDRIRCFKYRRGQCDWEVFYDSEAAAEWILIPLEDFEYRFQEYSSPESDPI